MTPLKALRTASAFLVLSACGTDVDTPGQMPNENGATATTKAYVGVFGDNAVAVVDLVKFKVASTIAISAPDGIVSTPDGAKVYVSSNDAGQVAVIETATDRVATRLTVGAQPSGLSVTADGKYVVVAVQGDGEAVIIDTASDTIAGMAPVGKAHSSATSPDGARAFLASQLTDAPAVAVIEIPSATPGPTFALEASPRALCDVGGKLYATLAGSADVLQIDATTGEKLAAITTAGSPHDVRPTADGSAVLTVSQTGGELDVIDPVTAAITAHIPTGTMPHWIGLAKDGSAAYVTNEGDNTLVLVDLQKQAVTRTLALGHAPRKIAVVDKR
ncbi:MAG TPA: YncE family protein [Polyangiaceae bacterium]|jgi:YVTN family beta-propeller protein|nr:YncE family protein [Polyangiaceae bacterium]